MDGGEQSADRILAALPDLDYPHVVYHLRVLESAELAVRDSGTWSLDIER
jgi:hypothetical protein